MARTTDPGLRNQTVYCIFIRNHSAKGTFVGAIADLDRIADLGVTTIWLMPIHPIGTEHRKGTLGSPYAIADYRAINPEYGDLDEFVNFLQAAHIRGLRVVIDVVYNHTSPDSLLTRVHPEWFWRKADGTMGNRIGEWWDVVDLDYSSRSLWDYQIESLKGWLLQGVDGFRCDVASLLPLPFWLEARDACAAVNPDTLWVAETVETSFVNEVRRSGYDCLADTEVLRAFDVSYDYDVYPDWCDLVDGRTDLRQYIRRLRIQESMLSDNDLKLRFLENHDKARAAGKLSGDALRQWTAFSLFTKGVGLVYAGGEYAIDHKPDLFDPDPVDWSAAGTPAGREQYDLVKKLISLKKDGIVRDGFFWYPDAPEGILAAAYERRSPDGRLTGLRLGVFNFNPAEIPDWDVTGIWPELKNSTGLVDSIGSDRKRFSGGRIRAGRGPVIADWGLIS